jgi:putative N-acetylmannosamine-6-phosphate epimerase
VTDALYFLGQHCTERSQAARVAAAIRAIRAAVAADRAGLPAEALVELDRLGALVDRAEAEARGGAAADAIDEYATAAFRTAAAWSVPVIGIIGREWRQPSHAARRAKRRTEEDRLAA